MLHDAAPPSFTGLYELFCGAPERRDPSEYVRATLGYALWIASQRRPVRTALWGRGGGRGGGSVCSATEAVPVLTGLVSEVPRVATWAIALLSTFLSDSDDSPLLSDAEKLVAWERLTPVIIARVDADDGPEAFASEGADLRDSCDTLLRELVDCGNEVDGAAADMLRLLEVRAVRKGG
jgi:hypothetical protein